MVFHYKNHSEFSAEERHDLYRENQHLKKQLHKLLDSVGSYRGTQHKFENFELMLLECRNLKELISCLIETLPVAFKLDRVSLTLFDPENIAQEMLGSDLPFKKQLNFCNSYLKLCLPFKELKVAGFWSGKNIGTMLPLLGYKYEFKHLAGFTETGVKSVAILPLIREHLLIGYLCLGSCKQDRFDPELAIEMLSHLSAVIAICLENTMSREQLHQLSQIDMLTRVKNRRAFDRALLTEISRSQRGNLPLSCLYADLDFFKKINDTYGHSTGDRTLKAVASAIQKLLRKTDVLARIGGEEFTILLPNTEAEKARDIAERIRNRIEQIEIPDDQGFSVTITTSIGYATWKPSIIEGESVEDIHRRLMGTADKAVYKAKQSGRNRVRSEVYSQLRGD